MIELRKPIVVPLNDHVWLLNDHDDATCYVVAGSKMAAVIDTSVSISNIREAAEELTSLPLICINTHGHGDHMGGIELEVIYTPGHTPGEIVLLDRKDKMLFCADAIIQHLWMQLKESLPIKTQIESMERLLPHRSEFDKICNGHCYRGAVVND